MALNDRLDFEEGKISSTKLFLKTCCQCKYWIYKISNSMNFCHKCINNPKVKIKNPSGYNLETLFDYYHPIDLKLNPCFKIMSKIKNIPIRQKVD